MISPIVQLILGAIVLTVAFAILSSVGVKYFARPLPYAKALLISMIGFAATVVLYIVYFVAKTALSLPNSVDGLVTLLLLSVAGTIITKLARSYGIDKTGWLGIGAKSIFVLIGLSWVLVAIGYAAMQLR